MSYSDYQTSRGVPNDMTFDALIMAAVQRADTDNLERLGRAFPELVDEAEARAHAPDGSLPDDPEPPRPHVLSYDCWCKPRFDGERYHHQGDTSGGFIGESEAWLTPDGGER